LLYSNAAGSFAAPTRAAILPKELALGIRQAAHPGEKHGETPWRMEKE
jgi:hypothetical protein